MHESVVVTRILYILCLVVYCAVKSSVSSVLQKRYPLTYVQCCYLV